MKVAALNFFPAFCPPKSGGELRYYHLYKELGRYCDVKLISATYPFVQRETVQVSDRVIEHRIPKGRAHVALHRFLDLVAGFPECSGVVVAMASRLERTMKEEIRHGCEDADVVIYDFPFLYPLAQHTRPGTILAYNAHNVEYDLQRACLAGPVGYLLARYVRRLEKQLCRQADIVFASSNADISRLVELYEIPPQKCHLTPNGMNLAEISLPSDESRERSRAALGLDGRKLLLFLGSYHPPNLQAARYILHRLAPLFPSELFVIAGSVSRGLTGDACPPNVMLFDRHSEDAKLLLLTAADVALNPMFTGSGTNLKILEYLAYGIPTLTTPVGARGLELSHGIHALVAAEQEFPQALDGLLNSEDLWSGLRSHGRALVEDRFDWREIARKMFCRISATMGHRKKPQLTVLNDFPCFPPMHGGKIRLYGFYKSLSAHYDIDYVCYDDKRSHAPAANQLGPGGFQEIRVPKSRIQIVLERLFRHTIGIAGDDIVAMLVAPFDRRFGRIASYSMNRSDLVIGSHIYLYSIVSRFSGRKIYDSLNCEFELKRQMLSARLGRLLLPVIRRQEARACRDSDRIFATCAEDTEEMIRLYDVRREKFIRVLNGVTVKLCEPTSRETRQRMKTLFGLYESKIVTFMGSGHPPNGEAAQWIANVLAPSLGRDYLIFLVGSACWALKHVELPPNLILFYEVEESVKRELLRVTDVAINPVHYGSGSNLKMVEYMAWGLPIVATPIGARGLALVCNVHVEISDRQAFAETIRSLAAHPERCESIGSAVRSLAEAQFDWDQIAKSVLPLLGGGKDAQPTCRNQCST